jgi:hypothetical protein
MQSDRFSSKWELNAVADQWRDKVMKIRQKRMEPQPQ